MRASLAGTVGFAGSIGGKPVVTVLHGGRRTTYEPVVASVERGQVVAAGDVLGRLVVTDSHCFPAACLHWGLIEGDGDARTYLDPLSLVGGGPVRLLPLWRDDPVTVRLPWSPPLATWRTPGRLARLSTLTSRPLRSSASLRRRPLRHTNAHRFVRLRMTLARPRRTSSDPHRYVRLRMTLARAEAYTDRTDTSAFG